MIIGNAFADRFPEIGQKTVAFLATADDFARNHRKPGQYVIAPPIPEFFTEAFGPIDSPQFPTIGLQRSEERRVGKERRSWWGRDHSRRKVNRCADIDSSI